MRRRSRHELRQAMSMSGERKRCLGAGWAVVDEGGGDKGQRRNKPPLHLLQHKKHKEVSLKQHQKKGEQKARCTKCCRWISQPQWHRHRLPQTRHQLAAAALGSSGHRRSCCAPRCRRSGPRRRRSAPSSDPRPAPPRHSHAWRSWTSKLCMTPLCLMMTREQGRMRVSRRRVSPQRGSMRSATLARAPRLRLMRAGSFVAARRAAMRRQQPSKT